jgi:hypothetical protein
VNAEGVRSSFLLVTNSIRAWIERKASGIVYLHGDKCLQKEDALNLLSVDNKISSGAQGSIDMELSWVQ